MIFLCQARGKKYFNGGIFMKKLISHLDKTAFFNKKKQATELLSETENTLTINDCGEYCLKRGDKISNFFICLISILTLYGTDCVPKDYIFKLEVITKSLCVTLTISFSELNQPKWIKAVGAGLYLTNSKHYWHLLQIFDYMLDSFKNKEPAFEATGMHFVCDHWIYAASNLLICPDRLLWTKNTYFPHCSRCKINCSECPYRLNSSLEGIKKPNTGKKTDIITSLIILLQENIQTALPIFIMNILSCSLSVFSKNGLLVPVVLWITGELGAGKTQLAMYLGTFYNKPKKRNDRQATMNRLRANLSTKLVLERLRNLRDNILLFDDVKAEKSTSLKDHTNTNMDTTVRSVSDQNSEGESIYCNAIITGEYVPSGESTLQRLILLPLKNFQETPKNLKTLTAFQEDGYLVTDFVILFIQWLCQKLNEEEYMVTLKKEKERLMKKYMGQCFSARNSEMLTTLSMELHLLKNFCTSNTDSSFHEKVHMLAEKGESHFLELVKDTAFLHGDRVQLYANIISDMILRDKSIRSAPEITYKGNLNYFNYCVEADESGIYIQNPAVLANDPYFMVAEHCQPYLLVRQKLLEEFPHELENYCIRHGIPASVYTKCKFSHVADFELILVDYNRSDGSVNRVVKYPSVNLEKRKAYADSFYCINLHNPLFKKLQHFFDKKEHKKLDIFFEHTKSSFDYSYIDEDSPYNNAEESNLSKYNINALVYELENVQKAFQNIFLYRHTKR